MSHRPPQLFLRFFRWFCQPDLVKYIEGDLHELYCDRLTRMSKRKARLRFALDVILLFRPGIIRTPNRFRNSNQFDMIGNYIKVGCRMLLRAKGYSVINVGGLAIGMTVAMLIGLWVYDELSFNKYHANYDNIVVAQDTKVFLPAFYMMRSLPYLAFYNRKKQLISVFEGSLPIARILEIFNN